MMEKETAATGAGTSTATGKTDSPMIIPQESRFMTAGEIAHDMKISEGSAYRLIRQMNAELERQGYITFRGRVNRRYYLKATGAGLDSL